jgi:2,3-bisphosphoglycerate-dependent phosphoglycerate mutase
MDQVCGKRRIAGETTETQENSTVHLFLIRHGQSFVNLEDWTEGFIDAGLTPLGHRQAACLGNWVMANLHIDVIYASTMARALETAAHLAEATGIPAQPDDRLREFGNCYADGTPVPGEAMPVQYPDFWGTEYPHRRISPDGESWMLFRHRVGAFVNEVTRQYGAADPPKQIAVVCHAGVIDAVFDTILNVGPHRHVEIWTHNTAIVHWEYRPESERETWRLYSHGLVHHLTNGSGEWLGSEPLSYAARVGAAHTGTGDEEAGN